MIRRPMRTLTHTHIPTCFANTVCTFARARVRVRNSRKARERELICRRVFFFASFFSFASSLAMGVLFNANQMTSDNRRYIERYIYDFRFSLFPRLPFESLCWNWNAGASYRHSHGLCVCVRLREYASNRERNKLRNHTFSANVWCSRRWLCCRRSETTTRVARYFDSMTPENSKIKPNLFSNRNEFSSSSGLRNRPFASPASRSRPNRSMARATIDTIDSLVRISHEEVYGCDDNLCRMTIDSNCCNSSTPPTVNDTRTEHTCDGRKQTFKSDIKHHVPIYLENGFASSLSGMDDVSVWKWMENTRSGTWCVDRIFFRFGQCAIVIKHQVEDRSPAHLINTWLRRVCRQFFEFPGAVYEFGTTHVD